MDKNNWRYKNFNMAVELDIAGEFIYNGIHEFHRLKSITNDAPVFSALYNISVGIERLQKIILVLWKFDDAKEPSEFEKSLITHSHTKLNDEIKLYTKDIDGIELNPRENEFITLLQEFYNTGRYIRFNIDEKEPMELNLLSRYLGKYIEDIPSTFMENGIVLTEEMKEFLGRVVGSVSQKYYKLVKLGSDRNHTFTYELRSNSKAEKIFLPSYRHKSLMESQFNERISFRELLVYIKNTNVKTAFFKYMEEIEPLEFDPALVVKYLEELSTGIISQDLIDEAETLYEEKNTLLNVLIWWT